MSNSTVPSPPSFPSSPSVSWHPPAPSSVIWFDNFGSATNLCLHQTSNNPPIHIRPNPSPSASRFRFRSQRHKQHSHSSSSSTPSSIHHQSQSVQPTRTRPKWKYRVQSLFTWERHSHHKQPDLMDQTPW